MSRIQRIVTTLVVLASAAVALGQANGDAVDSVRAADAAWLKIYATKDVAKSVAFCDEQGSMLIANVPAATGKKAVAKLIAADFAHKDFKISWHPDKAGIARSGDLGYTSGPYEETFTDITGKTVSDKGKYLTVWKKQSDGSWKVLFDMSSTDLPPT